MSIMPMKKINICAMKKDRKKLLEVLQIMGAMEIRDFSESDEIFSKINTKKTMEVFRDNAKIASDASKTLSKYIPDNDKVTSLTGRKSISTKDYYNFVNESDEFMKIGYTVVNTEKTISEAENKIVNLKLEKEALKPWENLDIGMRFQGTKFTKAFIGTISGNYDHDEIILKIKEISSEIENFDVEIIEKSLDSTYIFAICKIEEAEILESTIKKLGFAFPVKSTKKIPKDKINQINDKIKDLETEIEDYEKLIKSYSGAKNALKFLEDYYSIRSEKYEIISRLSHTRHTFILTGFVPENKAKNLEKILNEKFDLAMEFSKADEDENVPVSLKNTAFSSPVEPVLESYSLPGKGEIDPTPVMAVFYYILFGLMLSDAAYGLIMTLGCTVLLAKFRNMESGIKKFLKMFLYCGISTTFWGVMFGSYFGDAIEVVSDVFFKNKIVVPALWFVPLKEPIRMLSYSFALGIVHLFAGLFLKLIELFKARKYKDILYDVISWYLLVGGAIVYLLTIPMMTSLLSLDFILPKIVADICLIAILLGAVLIILTAGRESKNPFKRLLKGLYGLYGVTSYVSDIFSYSRLLALGLATGVIAQVFNKMGAMAGDGIIGIIIFIFVFLVGHTMNIAINLLGAYVHTNRLQFVEFFSKFYEGGGKKFSPFSIKTKYYKIREELNNG